MTTTTVPTPVSAKRLPLVLIINLCVALTLLTALPVIHHGQKGFLPHAKLDKDYVNAAISSGETEFLHKALKDTESFRAMAYHDHVVTMSLMQAGVGTLFVLFAVNCFALFRQHRRSASPPAVVPPRQS